MPPKSTSPTSRTKRPGPKSKSKSSTRVVPGATRRSLLWRFRRFFFFVGVIVVATAIGGLWAASQVQIQTTNPVLDQTSFVCTAEVTRDCNENNAIASFHGNVNRVVVPLSAISPEMQNAILAAEDKDFFKHGGVDPVGIARAAWLDIKGGSGTHGGSTLTQQYVKLTYLTSQRTMKRKLKEAVLSVKLEQELSKKQIFERYLNLVYFGRGAYGVQAAAQSYFDTDAKNLTLPQAAMLAGIIRNPTWANNADKSTSLRGVVLASMEKNGMITSAQRTAANKAPLGVRDYVPSQGVNWLGGSLGAHGEDPYGAKYFIEAVKQQLIARLGSDAVFTGGLRIYTTLEPQRQRDAYSAVTSVLNFNGHPDGSLVAVDGHGHVVAMMGGTDFETRKVNLATGRGGGGGGRPVGSTFKPFALAELVKQGYSIGSSVPAEFKMTFLKTDYPTLLNEDYPVQSDCCGSGVTNMVDATALSINSAYVKAMLELGPANVDRMAHDLGVSTRFETVQDGKTLHLASYVLGSRSMSVLDVATAYSTFARNGVQQNPVMVSRVEDRQHNFQASYETTRKPVLSPNQNASVVAAMQQVIVRGTGTSANIGRPAAGKTGTVAKDSGSNGADDVSGSENTDAWFTGFVPGLTASVWMGYSEGNKPMPSRFAGASYPAEIWKRFMQASLKDVKPVDFPMSNTVMAGKFLTSWGGTRNAPSAPTVQDFADGKGGSYSSTGGGTRSTGGTGTGSNGTPKKQGNTGPATTLATKNDGGSESGASTPPGTSPPATAPPPAETSPPATPPPAGAGGEGGNPGP